MASEAAQAVEVRRAGQGDAEWCAGVMAATDPWVRLGRKYEACLARLRHPGGELYLAWQGGERLGFILLTPQGVAGSPYVASVACSPQARGRGVGTALLEFAEALYPGARYIFLCVSSFNDDARRLYERRGYVLVGTMKDYVVDGLDEHLMAKRLVQG